MTDPHSKTGGTYGSNQYGPRGVSKQRVSSPAVVFPDMMQQLQQTPNEPVDESEVEAPYAPSATGFAVEGGVQPVWYGVATTLAEYPDRDTARKLAGHDWEPEERVLFSEDDDGTPVPVAGSKAIRRSDTREVLGVCNDTRALIGIEDMYNMVDDLVKQDGVHYEAAGSLGGGRKVWVICSMDNPIEVPGDSSRIYPYLTVVNRVTGPGSCSLEWTTMRSGNASTLGIGELTGGVPLRYQLRHTKNWKNRAEEIERTVFGVRRQGEQWQRMAERLASKHVSSTDVDVYLAEFVPMPPEGIISEQVRDNVLTARGEIRKILKSKTCEGIGDSAWGLVQASAEYLDHVRYYRTAESRFTRCLLKQDPLKRRAVQIAQKL